MDTRWQKREPDTRMCLQVDIWNIARGTIPWPAMLYLLISLHTFSSFRNIGKGESLIPDSSEDWLEAECPEAKRLKVLPAHCETLADLRTGAAKVFQLIFRTITLPLLLFFPFLVFKPGQCYMHSSLPSS